MEELNNNVLETMEDVVVENIDNLELPEEIVEVTKDNNTATVLAGAALIGLAATGVVMAVKGINKFIKKKKNQKVTSSEQTIVVEEVVEVSEPDENEE